MRSSAFAIAGSLLLFLVSCASHNEAPGQTSSQALSRSFTVGGLEVAFPAGWHVRTVNPTFKQVTPSKATGSPLVFSDSEPDDWVDGTGSAQIWFALEEAPADVRSLTDITSLADDLSSSDEATDVEQGTRMIAGRDASMLSWTTTHRSAAPSGYRFGVGTLDLDGRRYVVSWANSKEADPAGTRIGAILDGIRVASAD